MTDEELIARLRSADLYNAEHYERDPLHKQAADRIEALEAKLAKAVEALREIEADCDADYPPSHGAIKHAIRAVLAELEGEG
jgi:hypothetical protein